MQADIHLTLHRSDGLTAVRNSVRDVGLMDLNTRARRELLYVAISDYTSFLLHFSSANERSACVWATQSSSLRLVLILFLSLNRRVLLLIDFAVCRFQAVV